MSKLNSQQSLLLKDVYKKLSKYKPLKHEEFILLLKEYRETGNKDIHEKLINHNLRLAFRYIKKYFNTTVDPDDLFQSACMGLVKAIEKYDPDSGYTFSTYASYWFMSYVHKSFACEARNVKIPLNCQSKIYKLTKAIEKLNDLKIEPTFEELSQETGIAVEEVEALSKIQKLVFMDSIEASYETSKGHDYEKIQPYIEDNTSSTDNHELFSLWEVVKLLDIKYIATIDSKTDIIDTILTKQNLPECLETLEIKHKISELDKVQKKIVDNVQIHFSLLAYSCQLLMISFLSIRVDSNLSGILSFFNLLNKLQHQTIHATLVLPVAIGVLKFPSLLIHQQLENLYRYSAARYQRHRKVDLK